MVKPDPAYKGSEPYVFVSYSHADEHDVFAEIRFLQEQGVNVWYDTTGIGPGSEWNDEIAKAIKGADYLLYFITPRSVASEHCRRELNFAQTEHRPIIVVHLEETDVPDGLRLSLDNRQDIFKYEIREEDYRRSLLGAVGNAPVATTEDTHFQIQWSSRALSVSLGVAVIILLAVGGWLLINDPPATPDTSKVSNELKEPPSIEGATDLANVTSIAVLPFKDVSPNQDMEWLAAGLATQLRSKLSQVKGLEVLPRHATMELAQAEYGAVQLAKQTNVSALLDGVVQVTGNEASVVAELTDSHSGKAIWSQRFEGSSEDPIDLQEQILFQILRVLENHVVSDNSPMPKGRAAQNAYFRYMAHGWSGDFVPRKMWLEQTLNADPSFAQGQLDAYWLYINYARGYDDSEWLVKARSALDRAAELGLGEDAGLQMSIGTDLWQFRGQFEEALPYLRRALIERGLTMQYGIMMLASGLVDETRDAMEQIVLLQPYTPTNWWVLAQARGLQGDTAGALEAAEQMAKLAPPETTTHFVVDSWALSQLGRPEEIERRLAVVRKQLSRQQNFPSVELTLRVLEYNVAEAKGDRQKALQAIESLETSGYVETAGILYLRMENERATRALAAASEPPFHRLNWLPGNLLYLPEQYRDDPRIRGMLDAMGLTKQWRLTLCLHLSTLPAETHLSCDPSRYALNLESAG